MKAGNVAVLVEQVIRHCQIYLGVQSRKDALTKAKIKNFMDMYGNLSYTGRTIGLMMLF